LSERTVEEYVECIGALEERENPVSTSSIAQALEVSPASVSEMLHRLSKKGLVEYTPYGGATLTKKGRRHFLKLTRRHRLWEVFLNRYLGIGWEDVYQPACSLEHATSDLITERLAEFLDNPEVCPHGSPIPRSNLERPEVSGIPLADLETGRACKMVYVVSESNSKFLRYLTNLGLIPGAKVKVLEKAPFDGTLTIEVNNSTKAIGRETASLIMVEPI